MRDKIGEEKVINIKRAKTSAKKPNKRERLSKVATNAIKISPSQFVVENHGILSESYKFVKQMGQGIYFP